MATLNSTPYADGFRLPGEFEPHAGTWMTWPERPDVWREDARPAQKDFASVAQAIAEFEPVTVCASREQWQTARRVLPGSVRVVEMSSNDAWMRDYAPSFVVDDRGMVRGVDWIFNGYGGSEKGAYWPCDLDNLIAEKLLEIEKLDRYRCDMVLEGGSIHVDGEGTLITTEECLLNPNRNPGFSRQDIERNLKEYLGIKKVIWLELGVLGDDDNSGHVDDLCCFVRPGVVAMTWTDDTEDPQFIRSRDALERLSKTPDARGRRIEVHKIHQPDPIFFSQEEVAGIVSSPNAVGRQAGQKIGASYINFYIANNGVVVPAFGDRHDNEAVEILRHLFPDRRISQVFTHEVLLGIGNIHCIVMQQPLGPRR
jgi:agmatine deiminase